MTYLDAMRIDDAKAVIDLGCGTGVASRRIARRSGFSGHVTGIDRSPFLIDAAKGLGGDENPAHDSASATRRASISATASSMPLSPTR